MFYSKSVPVASSNRYYYRYDNPGNVYSSYWDESGDYRFKTITASGDETPNYRLRVKRNELLPFNSYSNSEKTSGGTWTCAASGGVGTSRDYYYWRNFVDIDKGAIDTSFFGVDGADLVQKAAAKLYGSGHDSLTFLAELHHLPRLFKGVAWRIKKILSTKSNQALWRELGPDGLSSAWLEQRYGWRTLLYDIQDLYTAVESFNEETMTRVSERVGCGATRNLVDQVTLDVVGPINSSGSSAFDIGSYTVNRYTQVNISMRGRVVADFTPAKFSFNPAVTAWELIPFSFVLDWLVSVGYSIQALSLTLMAKDYVACYGTMEQWSWYCYGGTYTPSQSTYTLDSDLQANWHGTEIVKSRTPATISLTPHFYPRLNLGKEIDFLALIWQGYKAYHKVR